MTAKALSFLLSFSLFAGVSASAATFTENFNEAFPAWKSGWLGTNSNLQNYLALNGGTEASRNGNPVGLWLDDGDGLYGVAPGQPDYEANVEIKFSTSFGESLTSLSFDLASFFSAQTVQIFDSGNQLLLSSLLTPKGAGPADPEAYSTFYTTSSTGIGGFRLLGVFVEGNTSIDNVIASTDPITQVPDTASTSLLVGLGIVTLAAFRRRYVR